MCEGVSVRRAIIYQKKHTMLSELELLVGGGTGGNLVGHCEFGTKNLKVAVALEMQVLFVVEHGEMGFTISDNRVLQSF